MRYSLRQIKRIRQQLDISQSQLAKLARVSQSLIAKIEAKRIDPSYSKVCKIFDTLEEEQEKKQLQARQMMHKNVIFAQFDNKLPDIIVLMRKYGISQVPVRIGERICGLITEQGLLEAISKKPHRISFLIAKDIMQEAPPAVSLSTRQKIIVQLLSENPIVLVTDKGKIVGVISKSDLFEKIA